MKTLVYVVSRNLDIPKDAHIGETFEIVGTATVVKIESTTYFDGTRVYGPIATVTLEVRKA